MIRIEDAYVLLGLLFLAFAGLTTCDRAHPRRARGALFWGLLATSMLLGDRLGGLGNGLLALALATVAALGGPGASAAPVAEPLSPDAYGDRLFLPALAVPVLTVAGTLLAQHTDLGRALVSQKQTTLIMLGLACLSVLAASLVWLRPPLLTPVREGRRLMESIGWAALMPQMLAALGAVFVAANIGGVVGGLASRALPLDTPVAAVSVYCIGMAAFTVIMGNAFAAFPVMTAAIGLPLLIRRYGGDPAIVCAIGMLSGFCGTLLTPMAANFNVVPANLLELPDRDRALNGVIRAQAPTALIMLFVNIVLMSVLAFRF